MGAALLAAVEVAERLRADLSSLRARLLPSSPVESLSVRAPERRTRAGSRVRPRKGIAPYEWGLGKADYHLSACPNQVGIPGGPRISMPYSAATMAARSGSGGWRDGCGTVRALAGSASARMKFLFTLQAMTEFGP